jgi:hypothetical protein
MLHVKEATSGYRMLQLRVFSGLFLKITWLRKCMIYLASTYRYSTGRVIHESKRDLLTGAGKWSYIFVMPCRCCVIFHCTALVLKSA